VKLQDCDSHQPHALKVKVKLLTYAAYCSRDDLLFKGFGHSIPIWQSMTSGDQNQQTFCELLKVHVQMLRYWLMARCKEAY
jgi:hypothetical protein